MNSVADLLYVMVVIGTIAPWVFFGGFFASHASTFLCSSDCCSSTVQPPVSRSMSLSIGVFGVWSFLDAREIGTRPAWVVLPAGCLAGLSLPVPLYLYLCAGTRH